jgi:hypothetical protein
VWDLRSRPVAPQQAPQGGAGGAEGPGGPGGGGGFGGFGQLGLRVDPGDYTVKIKLGDKELSKTVKVIDDPRIQMTADERARKREALNKLQPLVMQAQLAQTSIVGLRTNLNTAIEAWKRPGAPQIPDNVKKAAEDLLKRIDAAYVNWGTPPSLANTISSAGPPLVELPTPLNQRVGQLLQAIENTAAAPTDYELSQLEILSKRIPPAAADVRKFITEDLVNLNNMMRDAKVPYIQPPTLGGGQGGPQRPPNDDDVDDPDNIEW